MPNTGRVGCGPKALIASGALLTVGSLVLAVVGFFMLGSGVYDQMDNILSFRENLAGEAAVPGTTEMELEAGKKYNVLAMGDDLVSSGGQDFEETFVNSFEEPDVTILDPDGNEVELGNPAQITFDMPETDAVAIADFKSGEAGTYTMEVSDSSDDVDAVGVGDALTFDDFKGFAGSVVALAVAGVAAMVGLPLLVGGIIWAATSKKRATQSGPGGPGMYPPPTWGPPGPGQPGGFGQSGGWS